MSIILIPLFLLVLLPSSYSTSLGTFSASKCMWTDPSGIDYELSSLKKPDFWKVKDGNGDSGLFAMDYLFNFCQTVSQKCKNQYVGAFEALEVLGQLTETCEVLGKNDNPHDILISALDASSHPAGLRITYPGGDTCTGSEIPSENGFARKITFKVLCAETQDANFAQSRTPATPSANLPGSSKCNMEFYIHSPAGCRVGGAAQSSHPSLTILFWLLIIFFIYLSAGITYNIKVKGKKGMESLPNREFWMEVPTLFTEGIKVSWKVARHATEKVIEKVKGKGAGRGSGYAVV